MSTKGSWKRPTIKKELANKNWELFEKNRLKSLANKKEETNNKSGETSSVMHIDELSYIKLPEEFTRKVIKSEKVKKPKNK